MKFLIGVTLSALFAIAFSTTCNVNEGQMLVTEIIDIFSNLPTGNLIPLSKFEKDKYFAGHILSADVTHLCKELYEKFDDLQTLGFRNIPIESFDDNLFDGASNIENLEFDGSDFTQVKAGIFKNIKSLEVLEISNTPVEKIDVAAFVNLPKLETLVISHAKLARINPAWFSDCPSIVQVDFSNNKIKAIATGDFAFMKPGAIHNINLANNKIKIIGPSSFNTQKFELLNLEGNRIKHLSTSMFSDLQKNGKIDLTNNRFTCIDDKTVALLKHFKTVVLDDNSVEEDCNKTEIISQLEEVEWLV